MNRLLFVLMPLLIFVLIWGATGCGGKATPAPTGTPTAVSTHTATGGITPSPTPIPTTTPGPSPTATTVPTATSVRTPSPTPAGTVVATPAPTPTPAAAAKPEGELKIALSTLYGQEFDPLIGGSFSGKTIYSAMYDILVGATPDGELSTETGIARRWEHSADYLSWTFYIREGVKFHNGDDLTAEDVTWNLGRMSDPQALGSYARALSANIKEIVIDGPYQVTVNLKSPEFFLDFKLSQAESSKESFILPKKYIQEKGRDYFLQHPIGSGPYRLVENVRASRVKLEAVDNHWLLGVPKYKYITLYEAPEEITRIAMFKTGQVDIMEASRQAVVGLQKEGYNIFSSRLDIIVWPSFHVFVGGSNPLSDKRVREALWLAIDATTILDTIFLGQGVLEGQRYQYPFVLGSVDLPPKPYDPERARQLLKEAGYPERFANPTIEILSFARSGMPEGPVMMEAIASYFMKVGVRVKVVPTDLLTFGAKQFAKTLVNTVAYGAFAPSKMAALGLQGGRSVPSGPGSFFTDPIDYEYDAMADEQLAAKTPEEYIAASSKMFRYEYENVRSMGLFALKLLYATNQEIKQWDLGMYSNDFLNLRDLTKR